MKSRKRYLAVILTAIALIVGLQLPSHSASSWRTRATVIGMGAGFTPSSVTAGTVVPRPYAIRLGFATPNGVSKIVEFDYDAFCDTTDKSAYGKKLTTPSDGSVKWFTVYAGTNGLGDYCDINVFGSIETNNQLRLLIQYKQR